MSDHATCDTDAQNLSRTKELLARSLLEFSNHEENVKEHHGEQDQEEGDMKIDEEQGGSAERHCSATVPLVFSGGPAFSPSQEGSQETQSLEFPARLPMPAVKGILSASQDEPDVTRDDHEKPEETLLFCSENSGNKRDGQTTMQIDAHETGSGNTQEPVPYSGAPESSANEEGSRLEGQEDAPATETFDAEDGDYVVSAGCVNQAEEMRRIREEAENNEARWRSEVVEACNLVALNDVRQNIPTPHKHLVQDAICQCIWQYVLGTVCTPLSFHPNGFGSVFTPEPDQKMTSEELGMHALVGVEVFFEIKMDHKEEDYFNQLFIEQNTDLAQCFGDERRLVKKAGKRFAHFVVLHAEREDLGVDVSKITLSLYPADQGSLERLNELLPCMPLKKKLLKTPHAFWSCCHNFLSRDMKGHLTKKSESDKGPSEAQKQVYREHILPNMVTFKTMNLRVADQYNIMEEESAENYIVPCIVFGCYVGPYRLAFLKKYVDANPLPKVQEQNPEVSGLKELTNSTLNTLMKKINICQRKKDVEVRETDFWLSKLPEEGTKLLGVPCHNLDLAEIQLLEILAVVSDMQEGGTKRLLSHLLQARLREIHDHKTGGSQGSQIYFRDLTQEMGRHALALKVMGANVDLRRTAPNFADGACDTVAAAVLTRAPSNCELIARLDLGSSQFQKELDRILDWHSRRVAPSGEADPWAGVSKKEAVEKFVTAARAGADRLKQAQQGGVGAGSDGGAGPDTEKRREFVALCMAECIGFCLPDKDCEQRKTLTDCVDLYLGLCHSGVTRKFLTGISGPDVFNCTVCYLKSEANGKEEGFRELLESAHDGLCDAKKAPGAIQAAQAFLASHGGRGAGCKRRRH